ncbi:MAG: ATP-binding domain-containing protein, partial [Nitriliruptorales bacterium]|nr:ATP-binding domain-containing protein [Nitriliruptorales bacterium]
PRLIRDHDVLRHAIDQAVRAGRRRDGVIAVVSPEADVAEATARLEDALQEQSESVRADLTERIHLHEPRTVKGLEFDAVVVAAPDRIVDESAVGAHQLYVVVTRTTDELVLVAAPDTQFPGLAHVVEDAPVPADHH